MATRETTQWFITCDCIVRYAWDDQVPQDQRVHTLNGFNQICSEHKALQPDEVYDAVVHEDTTKQDMRSYILNNIASVTRQVIDQDGNSVTVFQKGLEPVVTYDPIKQIDLSKTKGKAITARPMTMKTSGMVQKEIDQIQQFADSFYGPGIVTVV